MMLEMDGWEREWLCENPNRSLLDAKRRSREIVADVIEGERRLTAASWPSALIKASFDQFDSAVALRDGTIITFQQATPSADGQWVHLIQPKVTLPNGACPGGKIPFGFERGMDVRVADIVWACDAPWGS